MRAQVEYLCCYCDLGIEPGDETALRFSISRVWSAADEGWQEVYAHANCAAAKFATALSQNIPLNPEFFAPEEG